VTQRGREGERERGREGERERGREGEREILILSNKTVELNNYRMLCPVLPRIF
jgi:hypothetical protein